MFDKPSELTEMILFNKSRANTKRLRTIYFVYGAGLIKIGIASNLKARFSQISGDSPVPVSVLGQHPGTLSDERELHNRFASYNHHREWFRDCPEMRQYIDTYCE